MSVVAASAETIAEAADHLRQGRLVAFPTETVYGLGADATNGQAVARIFEAKGRPRFNPLIVHVPDLETAERHADFAPRAQQLAERFWPGPLTLVQPRRADSPLSDLVTAGLETVALRMPDHTMAQALLKATGLPLAAPSANRSGHVSPTLARHVEDDLGNRAAMILDAGATAHGLESTVVAVDGESVILLRAGAVPTEALEAALGARIARRTDATAAPNSPGQLASHYAPRAALRLNALNVEPGEAVLAFGPLAFDLAPGSLINLSAKGDLREAAANLFAALRTLDATGARAIAVVPIPEQGLGEAINDRLRRAAAPR